MKLKKLATAKTISQAPHITHIKLSIVPLVSPSTRWLKLIRSVDLLRVLRHGTHIKEIVDDAVNTCGQVYNVIDSIEDERMLAEEATDPEQKKRHTEQGDVLLRPQIDLELIWAG